jgi:tetratricopeptide (TPR) repeat protein
VILLVVPFAAPGVDPDALDVARFSSMDAAASLDVPGVEARRLLDEVEISAAALGSAAAALGADAALGATIELIRGEIVLDAIVAGPDGSQKAAYQDVLPLGSLPQIGRMLARAALLALGEDAAAPASVVEMDIAPDLALRLAATARQIEDQGDAQDLLELAMIDPPLFSARRMLLDWCSAELGTPGSHAALERFCEARPDDAQAILMLAESRALLLDEAGAREMYLQARENALDAETEAAALSGLATLAEDAGRNDEAIAHLRAAVKLVDDAALYSRLSHVLKDPTEAIDALTKATVLAPDDAELHLELAAALRTIDPKRALTAAAEAARLSEDDPDLAARVREELEQILATQPE